MIDQGHVTRAGITWCCNIFFWCSSNHLISPCWVMQPINIKWWYDIPPRDWCYVSCDHVLWNYLPMYKSWKLFITMLHSGVRTIYLNVLKGPWIWKKKTNWGLESLWISKEGHESLWICLVLVCEDFFWHWKLNCGGSSHVFMTSKSVPNSHCSWSMS